MVQKWAVESDGPQFEYQFHHLLAVRLEVLPQLYNLPAFSSVKWDTQYLLQRITVRIQWCMGSAYFVCCAWHTVERAQYNPQSWN